MKYTVSFSIATLLSVSSAWADTTPYYGIEVISTTIDADNNHGPFPSAITEDGALLATYAFRSLIEQDTDIGLPFTFNQRCFYDDNLCQLRFGGSENTNDLSFENAYQAWRNAMFDIDTGLLDPSSYFVAATSDTGIEGFGANTDVKVTDVVNSTYGLFSIGYGSAPYTNAERDFVRRGFIVDATDTLISLMPDVFEDTDEDDYGGFTSAYKMRDVTYDDGTTKTLIVGHTSQSFAGSSTDYFDNCYTSGDQDERFTLNDLVNCPGFDTQAWAWEYLNDGSTALTGFALATEWLDDNSDNEGSEITYSAAALDINNVGIAVGLSTFENDTDDEGGRQRAIMMIPDEEGVYAEPLALIEATSGISDEEDSIYNTWAKTISDHNADNASISNMVMGNREYAVSKARNLPSEMFIYDYDNQSISFPFLDLKVLSTRQRLGGDSASKTGANTYGYDMNNNGLVVGKADAYDQTDPVLDASPREQSAFLYDSVTGDSWFVEDLLCSEVNGVVEHPLIRLQSATAINDDGVILAEGFQYSSIENYTLQLEAVPIMLKLTPDLTSDPDSSPNCWVSDALISADAPSERQGGGSFWLWLFALPVLLLRRFTR